MGLGKCGSLGKVWLDHIGEHPLCGEEVIWVWRLICNFESLVQKNRVGRRGSEVDRGRSVSGQASSRLDSVQDFFGGVCVLGTEACEE